MDANDKQDFAPQIIAQACIKRLVSEDVPKEKTTKKKATAKKKEGV